MALDIETNLLLTLELVAGLVVDAHDPWWVFGGSAAVLYGLDGIELHDVDVLMSPDDARRVLDNAGVSDINDGGTERFRSRVYGQVQGTPLPIDVLAGFEIKRDSVWVPVQFGNPLRIELSTGPVFVPQIAELIAVFRLCGRAKDLERADRLEALP